MEHLNFRCVLHNDSIHEPHTKQPSEKPWFEQVECDVREQIEQLLKDFGISFDTVKALLFSDYPAGADCRIEVSGVAIPDQLSARLAIGTMTEYWTLLDEDDEDDFWPDDDSSAPDPWNLETHDDRNGDE